MLREPLETGRITISRAARQADFPARFQLVAAMNPVPLRLARPRRRGRAAARPMPVRALPARGSAGPLLDRIDLQIEVPALADADLLSGPQGESSNAVRERVARARAIQQHRQGVPNARLAGREIEERARIDADGRRLLREAIARLGLSARAHHRVLKVARTLSDLEQLPDVNPRHIGEALRYRGIHLPPA